MNELLRHPSVSLHGPPLSQLFPAPWRSVPSDYLLLMREANGIVFHDGAFRVFGMGSSGIVRDASLWNKEAWRTLFSSLSENLVFWGENVFGDQYGFDLSSGDLIRLVCESGEVSSLGSSTMRDFLENEVLVSEPSAFEKELVREAYIKGLRPALTEHLSFILPLSCGGAADSSNLEVMDAGAHLDLLGQLVNQLSPLAEGSTIAKFTE